MLNSVLSLIFICALSMLNVVEPMGTYEECFVFKTRGRVQFQFGGFIVTQGNKDNIKHEYGHYLQEKMLGIYYLPLVGSTSLYGVCRGLTYRQYDKLWSEQWANKLGETK